MADVELESQNMAPLVLSPIGIIRSCHKQAEGAPIQSAGAKDIPGVVELFPQFQEGLEDIEGFSHLILLYHCHLCSGYKLTVKPFLDDKEHGLFATRAPARPNPIGMSIVRLEKRDGNLLHILDVDIVDQTPLLDIKPHVPAFHVQGSEKTGWIEDKLKNLADAKDDERFQNK